MPIVLLAMALLFSGWTHGTPCGGGGFLVTSGFDCNNLLTTGGADPLTPN